MAQSTKAQPTALARARRTASPRRSKVLAERLTGLVTHALENAAELCLGHRGDEFALMPLNPVRVVVALSGGRDSMALLDIVEKLFHRSRQCLISRVHAVYINHGLSPNAAQWEAHCQAECEARRIPFTAIAVRVNAKGEGVEAAAREERYRALARFAKNEAFDIILTAHHEDDRIETFLLQWLRGAGPEGLAAFPQTRELIIPGLAKETASPLLLVRPWSGVLRTDINRYAKSMKLQWVEDESNKSPKYMRNRIRNEVIPLFDEIRPGFRSAAARAVALTAEAAEVLRSVAQDDLRRCRDQANPKALRVSEFLTLIPARQAWCLRAWMQAEGMPLPNRARLEEGLRQIRQSHADTMLTLRVRNKELRRWGELLVIRDVSAKPTDDARNSELILEDGSGIALPHWGGVLKVLPCQGAEPGIAVRRLKDGKLEVKMRKGGEKIKLWPNRPSKHLKDLFSLADVPAFERADQPIIWLDGELLFVASLGMDVRLCDDPEITPERVRFEFHADASLWDDNVARNLADRS